MERVISKVKQLHFKTDVDKEILQLAWPSITEQLLVMMVGMVSTIFVGHISTETMAAVGMVNMLMNFMQTVFSGLSTGTTVVIARIIGEGDIEKARKALIQSIFMGIIIGVLIAILGNLFATSILKVFFGSADPKVIRIGLQYYKIILIGLPFLVLDITIAGAVRGAGDTKSPMVVTGIVNVINLILNSVLIFGLHIGSLQIPALGVVGTAIAVTVSRISGCSMRLGVLYFWKKAKLRLSLKDPYRIQPQLMARIIHVGIPAFLEQAVMQGGFLVLQVIIVTMGTVATAVYQVGVNVNSLAFMPIFGFSVAATTMVGQNLGKKDYKKAELYAYETLKIAVVVIACIGILMIIFSKPLASLYTTDQEVIRQSMGMIRLFGILEPLLGIMNVSSAVLRASGDIMYIMATSIAGLWSCRVFISFALHKAFHVGIYAVMVGIFFDFGVRAFMYFRRVNKGKWKYLKV